jgi:hypothetical protein
MIGRLFIVLVLCGALDIAASWNTSGNGFVAKTSTEASQPNRVIMTVAIEPDWTPPASKPVSQVGRSSRERLIAQNELVARARSD